MPPSMLTGHSTLSTDCFGRRSDLSLSFYTPPRLTSRFHIDVMIFAIGSLDKMDLSAFFGTCPELFRQDPSVSSKSTFRHASVPIRIEDVIRAWNHFSDHFFRDFGCHGWSITTLLCTTLTTTTTTWWCGSSSSSLAFLRHDGVMCMGGFSFSCFLQLFEMQRDDGITRTKLGQIAIGFGHIDFDKVHHFFAKRNVLNVSRFKVHAAASFALVHDFS